MCAHWQCFVNAYRRLHRTEFFHNASEWMVFILVVCVYFSRKKNGPSGISTAFNNHYYQWTKQTLHVNKALNWSIQMNHKKTHEYKTISVEISAIFWFSLAFCNLSIRVVSLSLLLLLFILRIFRPPAKRVMLIEFPFNNTKHSLHNRISYFWQITERWCAKKRETNYLRNIVIYYHNRIVFGINMSIVSKFLKTIRFHSFIK